MCSKLFGILLLFFGTATGSPPNGRIINGYDSRPGEIPQIVSLRVANIHNCGATILTERHLLTAAHCVQYNVSYYTIQYGVTHISSGENAPNLIKVSRVIPHENYTPGNGYVNDIAVVELQDPLTFGPFTRPIKLPKNTETPEYSLAKLSGWGSSNDDFITPDLQSVYIYVYSDGECERIHNVTNRTCHICAGVPEGGKGQCTGDSGGPLFVEGFQVGVVSWSKKPCTLTGYPGVFTKVSNYIEWILDKITSD